MLFFSVIIPTYNRAAFLPETIRSVLDQSFRDFELLVIDDGSTDNTEEVVRDFKDNRIRYFKIANGERGRARNTGIRQSRGEYVTFLDSDDVFYPDHLAVAHKSLTEKKRPEILHMGYEIKQPDGKVLSKMIFPETTLNRSVLKANIMSCMGVFIRKDVAVQYQFAEERTLAGSEDWLLWLRLAARYPIHHQAIITSALIDHASRSVRDFNEKAGLERLSVLIHKLQEDSIFLATFGNKWLKKIEGHMYTYLALHALMAGKKNKGFIFWIKGVYYSPGEFLTRRTAAIFKKILL